MNWGQIKDQFYKKFGDIYTEYFDDSRLSGYFSESYRRVVERQYDMWQESKKNLTMLSDLATTQVSSLSGLTLAKPSNYKYPFSIKLKYTVNGTVYYREAEMERLGKLYDPLDMATYKKPRYYEEGSNLVFLPTQSGDMPSEVTLIYLQEPIPCDLPTTIAVSPLIPVKLQDELILEAVKIASEISKDPEGYQIQENEIKMNP